MKKQTGFGLVGVLLIIGALVLTAGGVVVWEKKVLPTPIPAPQPSPIPTPEQPANGCSGLNEKECLANSDCRPVYGPSCPACMDIKFERCRNRLSCQTSADCPPVIGVCMPGNCPTYECLNDRCVFFEDAMVLRSCLEQATLQECSERYGR